MKTRGLQSIVSASMVLVLASLACGALAPAAPTAPPAASAAPAATDTLQPTLASTSTPLPAPTVDAAGTQRVEARIQQLQVYEDKGYIPTVAGTFTDLEDFKEEWAQIQYYQWWSLGQSYGSNFVYSGHFKWSSASSTPEVYGCGIVFGLQDSKDHYAVILDKSRILFLLSRGGHVYEVGKTRGTGRVSYGNPAEADFALVVNGQKAYVSADGQITEYTLSADQSSAGQIALTLLSGTNKDYGTRCEMTNAFLWEPQ